MNVRPSRVSSVSGVCTLSITLTGEDEYSISERSSLGRFDGIHHARASSANANSVSSSVMAKSCRPGRSGDGDAQLGVMVPHARHLAPRLRPGLVDRVSGRVDEAQPIAQWRRALELEAEQ